MKTSYFSYLISVFLILACSSKYQTDKNDPNYQSGIGYAPLVNGNSAESAAVAALITSISLAANRDYYKNIAITGKCVCLASSQSNLSIPCGNLTVSLTDPNGKELTRTETQNDEFAFQVPKSRGFRIQVHSKSYKISDMPTHDLFVGDDVVLHLSQKK